MKAAFQRAATVVNWIITIALLVALYVALLCGIDNTLHALPWAIGFGVLGMGLWELWDKR